MPLLKTVNVAVLFVSDLKRSRAFYGDTLGMPVKFEDATSIGFDFDPVLLIVLDKAGARDLLTDDAVSASRGGAQAQLVSFVDDVDAIYQKLRAEGVEFIREPTNRDWGLRTAHFKDPDGNVWEVAQELPK